MRDETVNDNHPGHNEDKSNPNQEPVWTYRGYRLKVGEFTTAMVHLFRAEVSRANVWRQRLDATTNWAVVTTGAAISIAFSQATNTHYVILLNILLVSMFLSIEARRYRYYELWSSRVRLMETDFFASMLVAPFQPAADWAEALAENLLQPHFPISRWEALGRRLRHNYFWIYSVLYAAWLGKLWLHPEPVQIWTQLVSRAAIGPISGQAVLMIGMIFYVGLAGFALITVRLREATGEVLPRFLELNGTVTDKAGAATVKIQQPWFRRSRRRQQLLTVIITDKAEEVSGRIIADMHRGVTEMSGKGMYTHKEHAVLLCAITITEVNHLKDLVAAVDSDAFVVVTPTQEVLGEGFLPLED